MAFKLKTIIPHGIIFHACLMKLEIIFLREMLISPCLFVTTLKGGDKKMVESSVERIIKHSKGKTVCLGHEITTQHY